MPHKFWRYFQFKIKDLGETVILLKIWDRGVDKILIWGRRWERMAMEEK